jgi:hypothetical protein
MPALGMSPVPRNQTITSATLSDSAESVSKSYTQSMT